MIESEIRTYHTHLDNSITTLRPEIQEPEQAQEVFPQTAEILRQFPQATQDLTLAVLVDTEFQELIYPDIAESEHLNLQEVFKSNIQVSQLKGDFFEYCAYHHHRADISCDQEVVSPKETHKVYRHPKIKEYFTKRKTVDSNFKHTEVDTVMLEKRDNETYLAGLCEVTCSRILTNLDGEEEERNKLKQLRQISNGEAGNDLLAQQDEHWVLELGEIFNGHFPNLPKNVKFDSNSFTPILILPELMVNEDGEEERQELGLENFEGYILRPPINRDQIDIFADSFHAELSQASGNITQQQLLDGLEILRSFSERTDESEVSQVNAMDLSNSQSDRENIAGD